jgi:hypothetical protein
VDVVYPDAERIVLVVDNLNIYHPSCMNALLRPRPVASQARLSGATHRNTVVGIT